MRLILREGRLEDLKAKNTLLSSEIDELASSDPSGNLKYLDWEVRQLKNGFSVNDIVSTVQVFHRKQGKFKNRDINAYKTLKELEDEAKELESVKTGSEARKEAKAGADTVYEDDNVIVKYIPSKEASCQYGKGTKWCITMKDVAYFEQYSGANVVFYFVMRKRPLNDEFDKVAIVVMRDQENKISDVEFYDVTDKKYTEIVKPLTPEIVDAAKTHAARQPKGLLAKIRSSEATEEEELKAIEMYPDSLASFVQFMNSKKALVALAMSKDVYARQHVAAHPDIPLEKLKMLAEDESNLVRWGVTQNEKIPLELLMILAKDEDKFVRCSVVLNFKTPSELLTMLAKDENSDVRQSVACNSNTPAETLTMLAKDENSDVRQSVACNSSTPAETLMMLAKDEVEKVRVFAKKYLKHI